MGGGCEWHLTNPSAPDPALVSAATTVPRMPLSRVPPLLCPQVSVTWLIGPFLQEWLGQRPHGAPKAARPGR